MFWLIFDNFLRSSQANCRSEVGSNTLRLDVFVPGLNGSSLGGELPLDPFFFFWFFGVVEEGELLEDEWEGSQPVAVNCLDLFSFLWHSSWAHWMFSVASYLVELHTFKCCDLCCLEELPVHLRMEIGLCSTILVVAVVK